MAKLIKPIAAIGLIVAGIVTTNPALISAGASLGLSTVADLMTGSKSTARQAQVASLSIGEGPREAIFGEAYTAGSLLDAFNYGGQYGTDWEVLAIALADHRCDQLVGIHVGDAYVPFVANGEVAGYRGQLKVTWHPGTPDQAADATLTSRGGWSANDRLAGVSYVVVEYKADANDAKNPVWPGGRPQLGWVVRGKRCYDPTKDSTVAGGAGTHRWADPSTWEWTDNLAICRYNWVRGVYACDRIDQPEQLLVGRGLSEAEAPPERVAPAAALCAEIVDGAPRYRCAAVIASGEQFADIEGKFAAACAGTIVQPEGGVEVEPGQAKAPVAYITDDDLIVGAPINFAEYRSEADEEWCNTVVARYVEPGQKWALHSSPVLRDSAHVLADRGPRERQLTLEYVRWSAQAQRCGEIVRKMGRLVRTATISVGPRFAELEEGDWIVWTSRRTRGVPVTFRIEAYTSDRSRQMKLTLREISADAFGGVAPIEDGSITTQQPPPPEGIYGRDPAIERLLIANSYPIGISIISADDSGSAAITTSDHTRVYQDGNVAIEGATLTGMMNSTVYYLFYDDADRLGGAVAIQTTTVFADAFTSAEHPARHYVGAVTTAATGGDNTGGGGGSPPGGGGITNPNIVQN